MSLQTSASKGTFQGIIDVLGVFAKTGAYGVIDRIAGALTPEAVEHALYDAMRSLNAMMRQAVIVKINVDNEENIVKLVDWTEDLNDPKYQLADKGRISEVITGPNELRGRIVRFVRLPEKLPSQEEIDTFLKEVKEKGFEGLSIARRVALLSLMPYRRR